MTRGWWVKFAIIAIVALISVYTALPTFLPEQPKAPEVKEGESVKEVEVPWYYKILPDHRIKLGLDLKGGLSLTIGVDTAKALAAESQVYISDLKRMLEKDSIAFKAIERKDDSRIINVHLSDIKKREDLLNFVKSKFGILTLIDETDEGVFSFDLTEDKKKEIHDYTIEQVLERQRNRIDEFGVAEPSIQKIGEDRILIQLPGLEDPERAQSVLERTALLEFKLVDKTMTPPKLDEMVENALTAGKLPVDFDQKKLNEAVKDKIPAGSQVLWQEEEDNKTGEKNKKYFLLKANTLLTGKTLEDARVSYDRFNKPVVSIAFNPGGAEVFKNITTDNTGEQLAIILDDKVYSAPNINEPIPNGRAQIEFGSMMDRQSTMREAQDLAVILRAGSLPAPVEILESRVVGPTLGKDSISKGTKSVMIGFIIVVIFMLFYYGIGGIFTDIALLLNMMFILSIMVALEATLTLPGIAGIALTLGIAVDANVIINERIREELKSGKPLRNAVSIGFKKSFLTILDANLTTLIAGFILLQYGTGPVKGFAVTMIIGIVISFFTAFTIVKLLFELYLAKSKTEKMYI